MFSLGLIFIIMETAMRSLGADIATFFPQTANDFSEISWAHAVNSRLQLHNSLHENVMMLEADVSFGKVIGSSNNAYEPIMAHPPLNESDINFKDWLTEVIATGTKGIKLDFKSTAVLEPSLQVLKENIPKISFPVWVNADILPGPVKASTRPVDASLFLKLCRSHFPESTISPSWTTFVNSSMSSQDKRLTWQNVLDMALALREAKISQSVTFPVRAVFVGLSINQLQWLMDVVADSSLTIWSSPMDEVDVQDLLVLRYTFPFNKIFYDLPLPLHTTFNSLKNLPNVVKPVTSLSNFKILQSPYFQHDINAIVGSRSVILLESSVINFTFPLKGQRSSDLIVLIKGTLEFIGPLQISRSDSFLTVIVNSNATLQIHLTNDEKIQVYNRNVWDIIQETRNPVEFDISLMNYDIELTLITINNIDTNQKMRYKKYKLHKLFDGQTAAFQFESSGQMPIVLSHLTTSDLQITSFASSNSEPVASACLPLIILIFIPILSFYSQDF